MSPIASRRGSTFGVFLVVSLLDCKFVCFVGWFIKLLFVGLFVWLFGCWLVSYRYSCSLLVCLFVCLFVYLYYICLFVLGWVGFGWVWFV